MVETNGESFPLIIFVSMVLPLTFQLVSGWVQYRTVVKTLGALPDPIVGENKKVQFLEAKISADSSANLSFKVPISTFRSGNRQRDVDVAKILGYPEKEYIEFEMLDIKRWYIQKFLREKEGDVFAECKLTVKGNSKVYTFKVHFKWIGGDKVELTTYKDVKFTDFGIEPPTLMGVVKRAEDKVRISGKFLLKVRP